MSATSYFVCGTGDKDDLSCCCTDIPALTRLGIASHRAWQENTPWSARICAVTANQPCRPTSQTTSSRPSARWPTTSLR